MKAWHTHDEDEGDAVADDNELDMNEADGLLQVYDDWCQRYGLVLRDHAIERLAQEAKHYMITRD